MRKKTILFMSVIAIIAGCASIAPVDFIWPTFPNQALEVYNGHEVPCLELPKWLGGMRISSLAFSKMQKKEAEWRHYKDELFYITGMKLSDHIIAPAEASRDKTGQALMALGIGSPFAGAALYLFGKGKKRIGDFTKEDHELELERVGNMDPESYRAEK